MTLLIARRTVTLGLAWAFVAGAALAAEERIVPAERAFPNLAAYLSLPLAARDRFELTYVLIAKSGSLAGTQVWLIVDGRRRPLSIAGDGRIARPILVVEVERGQVAFRFPPGARIGLRASVVASLRPGLEVSVATLQASLAQANSALHTTAVPFIGPPRLHRLVFSGAEGAVVVAANGRRDVLPIGQDGPYFEPDATDAGAVIRFRRPPTSILLRPG